MIKSMTAYGRSVEITPLGCWQVELHSVNRKGLDCHILIPGGLLECDVWIRKKLAMRCRRGQITLKATWQVARSEESFMQRVEEAKVIQKDMQNLCRALDSSLDAVPFTFLYEQLEKQQQKRCIGEKEQERLLFAVEMAMDSWDTMRKQEGEALQKAIERHVIAIEEQVYHIEQNAHLIVEKKREKLLSSLQEWKDIVPEDQDRILREIFFLAEKGDITEEIVRLRSHIQQCRGLFVSQEVSVGKQLEFLVQEMQREANTIASKADSCELIHCALITKNEIEKIREQVQNIE